MTVPFTRQLGARSGVQLNPVIDDTGDRFAGDNTNQTFGLVGRFERGRIDRAFRVNRSNLFRSLGKAASPKVSRLNEAIVHAYECLGAGAYEGVVSRLVPAAAVNSFMVCNTAAATVGDVWAVSATAPSATYTLYVKHLECFNDGIRAEINALAAVDGEGDPAASTEVVLRLREVGTGALLFEFKGSLLPTAKDEFNQSRYLPDVVSAQTDLVEVYVAASASVATTASCYGKDVDGNAKFIGEDLTYFSEGGTTYASTDYDAAITRLRNTDYTFGYILGGGTRAVSLLSKLIAFGVEVNKEVAWDVPGEYDAAAAITFYNQLNIDTHYSQCYYAPLKTDDPLNGGKDHLGTSAINIGLRCARNARTDANGIPPMNYPVAGKDYPLTRTGVIQTYTPTEQELDDLAEARINPVISIRYNSGSRFVFSDSLTGAKTEGDRKLIAVADMSTQVDDWVTLYAQECLQLPMEESVKRMSDFLQNLFEALEAAKWIKPSAQLDGRSFIGEVKPNAQRPSDRMDVNYWLKYDGTNRATYVQQTISK